MVQSVLNTYCLVSRKCCFCISLKVGTIMIALAGLVPSVMLILLYGAGKMFLVEHGVAPVVADVTLHLYAIMGILLCGIHVVLLVASITYNEKLILLYLWFACGYFVIDFFSAMVISISAVINESVLFGAVVILLDTFYWFFLYLFVFPVVNGFRRNIHTIVVYLA